MKKPRDCPRQPRKAPAPNVPTKIEMHVSARDAAAIRAAANHKANAKVDAIAIGAMLKGARPTKVTIVAAMNATTVNAASAIVQKTANSRAQRT